MVFFLSTLNKKNKMRCLACDVLLTEREDARKFILGNRIELCDHCFDTIREDVLMFLPGEYILEYEEEFNEK